MLSESVTTKISTGGSSYISKMLASTPGNWWTIVSILRRPSLTGSIVKLTKKDYERISRNEYAEVADALFSELAKKPYLLLVHEAILGVPALELEKPKEAELDEYEEWNDYIAREHFGDVPEDVRQAVHSLVDKHSLVISSYKRNAEASILASSFIEETLSNLLFRLYIPAGRLYEDELGRLLEMFHDWIGSVKNQSVRQGGYKTASGRVVEFYGDGETDRERFKGELNEFASFLNLLENPIEAEKALRDHGLTDLRARELVARYSKQSRRVLIDIKHERESRILQIRHQLESELSDELANVSGDQISNLVDGLVPNPQSGPLSLITGDTERPPQIVLNQQIFHHVSGVVAQSITGKVATGIAPEELLSVVRELGGSNRDQLEVDASELIDPEAPMATRISAKQRLKSFLGRNYQRAETAAFQAAWRWLEAQLGG